jgi:hypothetical protein
VRMVKNTPTYRKLPGKKKHFLMGVHRLWAAEDHLLQVHGRFGTEAYQRFYFKDIQVLITHKTAAGKIYNALLTALVLLLVLPAFQLDGWASIFFYCMAALFLLILLINWLLGPTCRTHLRTAVQQELLPSLYRLKTATKVMNQLKPYIQAAQGNLTPEILASGRPKIQRSQGKAARASLVPTAVPVDNPKAWQAKGRIHLWLIALLLVRAVLGLSEFYLEYMALTVIDMALFLSLFIVAIVFLVRQYDPPRHPGMLAIAWSTVAYVGLSAISGYAMFIFAAFKEPNAAFNQWKQIEQVARLSPNDNGFLFGLQLFFVFFALLLGIGALVISRAQNTGKPFSHVSGGSGFRPGAGGRV